MNTGQVAAIVGGSLKGDPNIEISGISSADEISAGHIYFAEKPKVLEKLIGIERSVVILTEELATGYSGDCIVVENPRVAMSKILPHYSGAPKFKPGIHPAATIDPDCKVSSSAYVGPQCVIGPGVTIGDGAILISGVQVMENSSIGCHTTIFPNVTIYHGCQIGDRVRVHSGTVIGSDGFGYVFDQGKHLKLEQIGGVEIHDDVEIGANCSIDRGALGNTVIRQGCKIDNLCQIAHNVQMGEHCILVSQVGVAGSSQLGKYVVAAGQAGISGHLKIGDGATIAGQAGVTSDLKPGATVMGTPAFNHIQFKKASIIFQKLPAIIRKLGIKL